MGTRARTVETSIEILWAFYEQSTWTQADLARRVGSTSETVRQYLEDMLAHDLLPLERDEDPPHVYWSVPEGTWANGLLLSREDLGELIRLLVRSPQSDARDALIRRLTRSAADSSRTLPATAWQAGAMDPVEERILRSIEDAVSHARATEIRYYASSRGRTRARVVSFQRIVPGVPVRTCGFCHESGALRWFRVDGVTEVSDAADLYIRRPAAEVDAFLKTSVDGFHDGGPAEEQRFFVRDPEARWVERNLIPPMRSKEVDGGMEVSVRSAGLMRIARYVVSLGAAARPLTEELAGCVLELAEGARANAAVAPVIRLRKD
jgi:predicted DNA-binding transcriptional regulator YafY